MSKLKKSIDNYVKGELIVRFERDVSKTFAEEFIKLWGYKILDDSRYDSKRLKGHMLIQVPKGEERETIETLQNYKKIIRFAELNGIIKGTGKNQSSQQKTLECMVCHEKIRKGDTYVVGNIGPVCLYCDSVAMGKAIHERNIASIDTENKKYRGKGK